MKKKGEETLLKRSEVFSRASTRDRMAGLFTSWLALSPVLEWNTTRASARQLENATGVGMTEFARVS